MNSNVDTARLRALLGAGGRRAGMPCKEQS